MPRKRRKRTKSPVLEYRRLSTDELRRRIQQNGDRGDVRAVIDMAKECYRRDASAAHAELLGDAYFRRARKLADRGLHLEATVVLSHALALGQASEELLRLAFECGLRSGQYKSAVGIFEKMRDSAERLRARCVLADEAVARGDKLAHLCDPAIHEDASRMRRAFAAFEHGDDQAVATELKRIGLRSPCAGWKWVLRGLTAYAHGDEAKARACWDRTQVAGQAERLARLLRSVLTDDRPGDNGLSPRLQAKLTACLGNPRLGMLGQIKEALHPGSERQVLEICKRFLAALPPEERKSYAQRLGRVVCLSLDWERGDPHGISRLFGPLPEDPRLTRVMALWFENRDPGWAIFLWKKYLDALQHVNGIPAPLQARARAMIWQRMGDLTEGVMPEDLAVCAMDFYGRRAPVLDATTCYRNSIEHYPDDIKTHEKLMEALLDCGKTKQAERQAEEILRRRPKHIKSLLFLGKRCFDRNAMRKALRYFDQAREAEPFNADIRSEMRTCLLFSARRRLDKGNLRLARKDYEQAEALCNPGEPSPELYCKWAALEWRAGDSERAEALFAQARAWAEDSLLLHYQMAIELDRGQAPAKVQDRFEKLLDEAWQASPTGAGAAAVVELTSAHAEMKVRYTRREAHRRAVMGYLQRASKKATFTEDQLLTVCRYLDNFDNVGNGKLLETYAQRAAKQFPENYFFPLYLGRAQTRGGTRRLPRKTRKLLREAGQQADQAGDFKVAGEIYLLLEPRFAIPSLLRRAIESLVDETAEGNLPDPIDSPEQQTPPPRRRSRSRSGTRQPLVFADLFDPETEEL